ncbi:multidrug ABC transporter ATP-binding protein [Tetzosporium hominis]|uniref:Multidrug ABC transporter ATP-binding protein n=1 Tax=Tetzosporium hominis TaxID=2020506 RepID=A0A264W661_9BACL|nr:ABC transporter ATP-binding protein [Tetzosporium hominis]OZS79049.1 multidrug ABC transporter ATP-binding protein [Tetzosporium hominis]
MSLLKLEHVTGGYSKKAVIHDLSFSVEPGELVGLIGLNGAGKSTTIKHIIGLLNPHEGTISINNQTLASAPDAYRKSFTYIPETPVLYEELTLQEHLDLMALAYNIDEQTAKQRVDKLLQEFRMEKRMKWFPTHFSKGMKQKVMIMSAFMANPTLYIIDEPFVGLDPLAIRALLAQLEERKSKGAGILMTTHVLTTAEKYCDKLILLHNGKVRAAGTMEDLRQALHMPGATLDDLYIAMTEEVDYA